MRNRWIILPLVLLVAASAGCTSKRQAVRGGEGEGGPGGVAGAQGGIPGQAGQAGDGVISTETVKADRGLNGPNGGAGGNGGFGGATGSNPLVKDRLTELAERQAGVTATVETPSIFKDIYFEFDQSLIRDDAKPVLAGIAAHMAKNPGAQLVIEGHCDSRGTAEYNMALGERRAEAAKKYLAALGVKPGALTTVSYGKEKPFKLGDTEEAWAVNRRGHFLLK